MHYGVSKYTNPAAHCRKSNSQPIGCKSDALYIRYSTKAKWVLSFWDTVRGVF